MPLKIVSQVLILSFFVVLSLYALWGQTIYFGIRESV
uniref:Uncharacterized protein n=1 Tax=Rhizophora mucronata TaxID=61149 RepID=A0A2P2P792_RHIMU